MEPDMITKIDQARKGVHDMMNVTLGEITAQLSEGHSEENIILGLHDYLTNWTKITREEFATLYAEALIRLAKSGESM